MGNWLKPKLDVLMDGFRKKDLNAEINCPWQADCPQHVYMDKVGGKHKREVPLPPKSRVLEQTQPLVRRDQCKYCGMV